MPAGSLPAALSSVMDNIKKMEGINYGKQKDKKDLGRSQRPKF
jgi:hypothetical protein